jgi:hypothetical protein
MGLGDIITRFFAREVKSVSGLELPNVDLNPQPKPKKPKKEKPVKRTLALVILALAATLASAQLPTNIYALGASWNQGASPQIAGTGLYARLVSADSGTYAFTSLDLLPIAKNPFTVTTNIGVGVSQKALTIGSVNFYIPTSAGISITGTNTGWAWTGGVLGDYTIKKNGKPSSLHIMPNVRYLKSSVSNGSGYQLVGGVLGGWGK